MKSSPLKVMLCKHKSRSFFLDFLSCQKSHSHAIPHDILAKEENDYGWDGTKKLPKENRLIFDVVEGSSEANTAKNHINWLMTFRR